MPTLGLNDLSKRYGEVQALNAVSFDVREGEILGFVGSNGAGKSTTMRIVLGVVAADGGEITWDGRAIDAPTRRRIGYMPEERGLYPRMKVGEQLTYLARLHGLAPSAASAAMERWTTVLGIETRRGDEVIKLSLGNQQRVQLAAALVHEPDLLVLDEPFSGLDPVAVDVMSDVLRQQSATGVPVVFSSHQLELVERLCDRVAIIRAGELVAIGTIEDLRRTEDAQWVVDGAPADQWVPSVEGARLVSSDDGRTVVALPAAAGTDGAEQAVLTAALAAGPVREFARRLPSLTELYRDVVSTEQPTDPATAKEQA
jgi:ABC-2 type transport system ATP-binding protein